VVRPFGNYTLRNRGREWSRGHCQAHKLVGEGKVPFWQSLENPSQLSQPSPASHQWRRFLGKPFLPTTIGYPIYHSHFNNLFNNPHLFRWHWCLAKKSQVSKMVPTLVCPLEVSRQIRGQLKNPGLSRIFKIREWWVYHVFSLLKSLVKFVPLKGTENSFALSDVPNYYANAIHLQINPASYVSLTKFKRNKTHLSSI